MITKLSAILLITLSSLCCSYHSVNDFDKVCVYFTELGNLPNLDAMTAIEKLHFITDNVNDNLPEESVARLSWNPIGSAASEYRYELFKSVAEETLNREWSCEDMKRLAATITD